METENEELMEAGGSLSDALSAAWDAAESDDGQDSEVHQSEGHEPESSEGEAGKHNPEVQPEGKPDGSGSGEEQEPLAATSDQPAVDLEKPPISLSPEAREAWTNTPDAVKAEFAKIDKRMEGLAAKYGESYQRVQEMDKTLQPYQSLFATNGGPRQTIENLLQTGAVLQMGTPSQKAQVAANIIKQFGVDIRQLDGLLAGEPDPQAQKQSEIDQLLQQRLAPIQQQLQQYQQREQQQVQQSQAAVKSEVDAFAQSHEFYSDVAPEMADLLDMAANRGRQMTMEEAYSIACSTHPSISKIMQARQSQQTISTKRAAASSVRGSPGSSAMSGSAESRLAALNDAWDNAGRM